MSLNSRLFLLSHSSSASSNIVSHCCKIRTVYGLQSSVNCSNSDRCTHTHKRKGGLPDRTAKLFHCNKINSPKNDCRLPRGHWNPTDFKCELGNDTSQGGSKTSTEISNQESEKSTDFLNRACLCCTGSRRDMLSRFGAAGLMATMAPLPSMAENYYIGRDSTMESVLRWHGKRSKWQEEFFAGAMANGMQKYESQVASLKQLLFQDLRETSGSMEILELGMGTGPNLALYAHPGVHVTAIDPNSAMRPFAQEAAKKANMSPSQLSFFIGVGESLPLSDNSIDVAIGTLVLCSVTDVEAVLREVVRVLKPGGRYIFLEHIAAPAGTVLRAFQGVLDPLQQFLADGCHVTRDPSPFLERVGFEYVKGERVSIPGLGLLSPHLVGIAQK